MPKVVWIIQHESGGNTDAVGDGGAAHGVFQSHYIPPGASVAEQFADAYRLYQQDIARGGTGFRDWGEGTEGQAPFDPKTGKGKFGALGNNPYPTNARTLASNAIGSTSMADPQTPPQPTVSDAAKKTKSFFDSSRGGSEFRSVSKTIKSASKALSARQTQTFTGDFKSQVDAYDRAYQDVSALITNYLIAHPGYDWDQKAGVVYNTYNEKDPAGTALAGEAKFYDDTKQRVADNAKNRLAQTNDSRTAYLNSQVGRATETSAENDHFATQVQNLAAIEDIPVARQLAVASALKAVNDANSQRQSATSGGVSFRAPQVTDTAPFAEAFKKTIPTTPTTPYQVPANAYDTGMGPDGQPVIPSGQANPANTIPGYHPGQGSVGAVSGNGPFGQDVPPVPGENTSGVMASALPQSTGAQMGKAPSLPPEQTTIGLQINPRLNAPLSPIDRYNLLHGRVAR